VSGIEDAGAQTTISLQEEPLSENWGHACFSASRRKTGMSPISVEEPHAQTGLRSGKLARIVHEASTECRTIGFFAAISTG
jgi:hypothetical protein